MIPHPHSENLEKKRKEHTNTNTAYTIINIISTIVILSNTISNTHYVISDTIYTDLNNDNTKFTSTDDNNMDICKDIRIHKTKDTIKILS